MGCGAVRRAGWGANNTRPPATSHTLGKPLMETARDREGYVPFLSNGNKTHSQVISYGTFLLVPVITFQSNRNFEI